MKLPIACTFTEAEMPEPHRMTLDSVRGAALDVTSLPLGYAYRFEPDTEAISQVSRLVDSERQCCPFLMFKIVIEAEDQPLCIEIAGPPETKAIIADFLGSKSST